MLLSVAGLTCEATVGMFTTGVEIAAPAIPVLDVPDVLPAAPATLLSEGSALPVSAASSVSAGLLPSTSSLTVSLVSASTLTTLIVLSHLPDSLIYKVLNFPKC